MEEEKIIQIQVIVSKPNSKVGGIALTNKGNIYYNLEGKWERQPLPDFNKFNNI